jgi:hypothetical protein
MRKRISKHKIGVEDRERRRGVPSPANRGSKWQVGKKKGAVVSIYGRADGMKLGAVTPIFPRVRAMDDSGSHTLALALARASLCPG